MNKNNKKTMNERTHNGLDLYKKNKNTNSNNSDPNNHLNEEFAVEFDTRESNNKQQTKRNK